MALAQGIDRWGNPIYGQQPTAPTSGDVTMYGGGGALARNYSGGYPPPGKEEYNPEQRSQYEWGELPGYDWEDWGGEDWGGYDWGDWGGYDYGDFTFQMEDWAGPQFGEAPQSPIYGEYGRAYPELELPRYEIYDEEFPEFEPYESEMLDKTEQIAMDLMEGKDVGIPEEGIQWQRALERVGKAEQKAQEELTRLSARGGRLESGLYGEQQTGITQKGLEERRYMAQDFAVKTAELEQEAKVIGAQIGLSVAQFESSQNALIYGAERDSWQAGAQQAQFQYQADVNAGMAEGQARERAWQAGMTEHTKVFESRLVRAQQEYDWFKTREIAREELNYRWFETKQTAELEQRYDWFKTQEMMGAEQAYSYFSMQQEREAMLAYSAWEIGEQQQYGFFTLQQEMESQQGYEYARLQEQIGAEQQFEWDMSKLEHERELERMREQDRLNTPTFGEWLMNILSNIAVGFAQLFG